MTLLLWLSCGSAPPAPAPEPSEVPAGPVAPADLDVTVDATEPATGRLRVELRFTGLESGDLAFARRGSAAESPVSDLSIEDAGGRAVPFTFDGAEIRLRSAPTDVVLRYAVAPGGIARHGHQGMVAPGFATYDGRILFAPNTASPLGVVRFRWVLPPGWRVAGPLEEGPDGWSVLGPGEPDVRRYWMNMMCFGLGPFTETVTRLGATEVRSYAHADLDEPLRAKIDRETAATFRAFHERLGFDPGYPIAFVRYPVVDQQPIFGGSSSRGSCFEAEKPGEADLNTRLLVHRFAHPFDRYPPSGWVFEDARDAWFEEGWAGWAEATLGSAAGVMADEGWYGRMYLLHLAARRDHPRWPIALSEDGSCEDDAWREYVHYSEAPLATRLLDHLLRERGGTSLEEVSRQIHARYGGHRGAVPLRSAIDTFGRASYADFWEAMADRPGGWMAPTWPGYVDDEMRARAEQPPLAWSGDVPVSADYLFHLAASGDFAGWTELLAFVAAEGPRRAQLRAAGITLASAEVLDAVNGIPLATRRELARAEEGWPVARVADTGPLPEVPLRWAADHPEAATVLALVEADRRYQAARGRGTEVDSVSLKPGPKDEAPARPPTLALPKDQRALFVTRFLSPPSAVVAELVVGGAVRETRSARLDPRQDEIAFGFHPPDRPTEPGILVFRIGAPSGETIERWYWQR